MKKIKNTLGVIWDFFVMVIVVIAIVIGYHLCTDFDGTMNTMKNYIDKFSCTDTIVNAEVVDSMKIVKNDSIVENVLVPLDSIKNTKITSEYEVPFEIVDNTMMTVIEVNGIPMKMMIDTGCNTTKMSTVEFLFLKRQGKISDKNFVSKGSSVLANGHEVESYMYKIDSIKIGNKTLRDVECIFSKEDSIGVENSPLLIGQSILSRLGKISIDYKNKKMVILN